MESSDSRHILSKNIRCVGTRMKQPPLKPEKKQDYLKVIFIITHNLKLAVTLHQLSYISWQPLWGTIIMKWWPCWRGLSFFLLFQENCKVADHYAITGSRAVTKISVSWVHTISRPGIEQLRSSFGSISLSLPLEPQYNLNITNLYITNSSLQ